MQDAKDALILQRNKILGLCSGLSAHKSARDMFIALFLVAGFTTTFGWS